MKKLVAACLPLVLIVVMMIVGVSMGESESLAGMVAGSHTATASAQQDDTCTIDTSISTVGTDELSRAEDIAKNLLANPHHIDMGKSGYNKDIELVSAILGNMKYESGFIPASYQATDGYASDGTVLGKFPAVTKLNVKRGQHVDNQKMLDALDRDGVREAGGRAIGLAQWDRGRSVELIKFAMGQNNVGSPFNGSPKQWDTVEVQAAFLLHEMVGSQKSFVDQIKGLDDFKSDDKRVRLLTEQWYRKFERGPLPEDADTADERKKREDNIEAREKAAVDLHRHVIEWAQQIPGWSPSPSSSGSCSSDSGAVEGGSLADFKYTNSPTPPAGLEVVSNGEHFSQYGWNPSGSFDAKLLSGSTGNWSSNGGYAWPQCTLWTAVRLLSLGLSQKLVAKGVSWGSLRTLGDGMSQADSLGKFGVKVDSVPHVHDVVSFPPGVAGANKKHGHVGVVEHVSADRRTITISEGNVRGDNVDVRTIAVDLAMRFAHVEEFVKG